MLNEDAYAKSVRPSLIDKRKSGIVPSIPIVQGDCWMGSGSTQNMRADTNPLVSSQTPQKKDACSRSGSDSPHGSQSGVSVTRKRRIHAQVRFLRIFISSQV